MPRDKRSERERLLTLIETDAGSAGPKADAGPLPGRANEWASWLKRRLSGSPAAVRPARWNRPLVLTWTNRVLAAAVAGVLIYAVLDFARTLSAPAAGPVPRGFSAAPVPAPVKLTELKTVSEEAERLFDPAAPVRTAASPEEPGASGVGSADAYRLVGVDWGGDEPVALIEDTQSAKTYFKRRGDKLGEFQIVEILRKKVVLASGGQKWEIQ